VTTAPGELPSGDASSADASSPPDDPEPEPLEDDASAPPLELVEAVHGQLGTTVALGRLAAIVGQSLMAPHAGLKQMHPGPDAASYCAQHW
jgi:hypothetical protein